MIKPLDEFMPEWQWARFGIVPVRWFLLEAIRREAEKRWRLRVPPGEAS